MAFKAKRKLTVILCGLSFYLSSAQEELRTSKSPLPPSPVHRDISSAHQDTTLTADDGLGIIAAALDARVRLTAKRDCSHLVHAIYVRAGFPYTYLHLSDLYAGTDEFQRVTDPQLGDLVVWRGQVGIIVNPAPHFLQCNAFRVRD